MSREGYSVKAKIESKGTNDPVNEGQVKGRTGFNLTVFDGGGHELDSERVISEGFAWKALFEVVADDDGEVEVLHKGNGPDPTGARFTDDPGGNGTRIGKIKPAGGYDLGAGIKALEASNGLRLLFNSKKWEDGNYTFRASVDGIPATFPLGNRLGLGKADKRKRDAAGGGGGRHR